MCGRYASSRTSQDLAEITGARDDTAGALEPRWNVAPTDPAPVVRTRSTGERVLEVARWGLVPHWSKDLSGGARMINARIETVRTKSAYRRPLEIGRALVPADGWYEWHAAGGRQPYLAHRQDGGLLLMAGLTATWHPSDRPRVLTSSVLTGPAPEALAWLHDRSPVVVPDELVDAWLDPQSDVDALLGALERGDRPSIVTYPVDRAVGNVRNQGPHLVEPVQLTGQPSRHT